MGTISVVRIGGYQALERTPHMEHRAAEAVVLRPHSFPICHGHQPLGREVAVQPLRRLVHSLFRQRQPSLQLSMLMTTPSGLPKIYALKMKGLKKRRRWHHQRRPLVLRHNQSWVSVSLSRRRTQFPRLARQRWDRKNPRSLKHQLRSLYSPPKRKRHRVEILVHAIPRTPEVIGTVILGTGTMIGTGTAIETETEITTIGIADTMTTTIGSPLIETLETYATLEIPTIVIENGIIGTHETEMDVICVMLATSAISATEIVENLSSRDDQMTDDRNRAMIRVLVFDQNGEHHRPKYQRPRLSRGSE